MILEVLNIARWVGMVFFAIIFAVNALELGFKKKKSFEVEIAKQLYCMLSLMVVMSLYLIGK